jgi:hypothetical protein
VKLQQLASVRLQIILFGLRTPTSFLVLLPGTGVID